MTNCIHLSLAQINPIVGDIAGNSKKILLAIAQAQASKTDLLCFPELALTGYPPEDLLSRTDFHRQVQHALTAITAQCHGIAVLIGHPHQENNLIFNAASWLENGAIQATYHKQMLPNYGVFDEKRYFTPGHRSCIMPLKDIPIGVLICEDLWHPEPIAKLVSAQAKLVVCINASPFHFEKSQLRREILTQQAKTHQIPIAYVHLSGGQDELVFDGGSMIVNSAGEICQQGPYFQEALISTQLITEPSVQPVKHAIPPEPSKLARIYQALTLGLKDYVHKNHYSSVIMGLSGGVDSALTLALAVDALGAEQVTAVMMPSRFTAKQSIADARQIAQNFKVNYHELSIEPIFQSYLDILYPLFAEHPVDTTEQNLQARTRGNLLMALSNKFHHLVITTGNKSELAVGYATLYGDMAGAFAVLKDIYKTLVYELVDYRNTISPLIPHRIIERRPSAELADNQYDEDNLPPYAVLDRILAQYIEQEKSISEITTQGENYDLVKKIIDLVNRNEYKRHQAPPGIRITTKAFGRDRRYPITSGFVSD